MPARALARHRQPNDLGGQSPRATLKEDAMSVHPRRHNLPVNNALHPLVYKSLVGLTVWLVLSIWFLFGGGAYVGLILAMITVFFVIVTGIPILIWLTWRRRAAHPEHPPEESFRSWAAQQFSSWTGSLSGGAAAAQILLPIAAVAFGMTLIGLVYVMTIPQVA
jgi:hypothetical protein